MEEFSMFWLAFWIVFGLVALSILVSIIVSIVRLIKSIKSSKEKKNNPGSSDYVPTNKPTFPTRIDSGYGFDNADNKQESKTKSIEK